VLQFRFPVAMNMRRLAKLGTRCTMRFPNGLSRPCRLACERGDLPQYRRVTVGFHHD
jgi:hypothetical protein